MWRKKFRRARYSEWHEGAQLQLWHSQLFRYGYTCPAFEFPQLAAKRNIHRAMTFATFHLKGRTSVSIMISRSLRLCRVSNAKRDQEEPLHLCMVLFVHSSVHMVNKFEVFLVMPISRRKI